MDADFARCSFLGVPHNKNREDGFWFSHKKTIRARSSEPSRITARRVADNSSVPTSISLEYTLELSPCGSTMNRTTVASFRNVLSEFLLSSPGLVSENATADVEVLSQLVVNHRTFGHRFRKFLRDSYTNQDDGGPVGGSRIDVVASVVVALLPERDDVDDNATESAGGEEALLRKAVEFSFRHMRSDLVAALSDPGAMMGSTHFVEPDLLEVLSLRSDERGRGVRTGPIMVTAFAGAAALLCMAYCVATIRRKRELEENERKGFVVRALIPGNAKRKRSPVKGEGILRNPNGEVHRHGDCPDEMEQERLRRQYQRSQGIEPAPSGDDTTEAGWTLDSRSFLTGSFDAEDAEEAVRARLVEAIRSHKLSQVRAPPGRLGIVLHTTRLGPIVEDVFEDSCLRETVDEGDLVVMVDDLDVIGMTSEEVGGILAEKSDRKRTLMVARSAYVRGDMI